MFISKRLRDAGIVYEADAGGSGSGDANDKGSEGKGDEMSPAELKAELERTRAALKTANKEAGDRRKALEAIENAKSEAEKAELAKKQEYEKLYQTEQAKAASLEKRLEAIEAERRRDRIRAAVEAEARKANFADPADAHLFLNLEEIEVDEKDQPKGVKTLVDALAKSKSYLLTTRTTTPGNGARPPAAGVKNGGQEVTSPVDKRSIF